MLPPPCHGGMSSSSVAPCRTARRSRRAEDLVPGEHEEVGVERLDVDAQVRDGLGAVDQHARAVAVGHLRPSPRPGVTVPERVGHLGERDELGPRAEQLLVLLEQDLARVVDRRDPQQRRPSPAHSICQGTMLAWCSSQVTRISSPATDVAAAPALRDEVDRLGRAAHEDDLARPTRALRKRRTVARAPPRRRRWPGPPACARRGGCWSSRARRSARAGRSPPAASASWPRCRARPDGGRAPSPGGPGSPREPSAGRTARAPGRRCGTSSGRSPAVAATSSSADGGAAASSIGYATAGNTDTGTAGGREPSVESGGRRAPRRGLRSHPGDGEGDGSDEAHHATEDRRHGAELVGGGHRHGRPGRGERQRRRTPAAAAGGGGPGASGGWTLSGTSPSRPVRSGRRPRPAGP